MTVYFKKSDRYLYGTLGGSGPIRNPLNIIYEVAPDLVKRTKQEQHDDENASPLETCSLSKLSDIANNISFFEALKQLKLSVRLRNVLSVVEANTNGSRTVFDFLEDQGGFRHFVLTQRNFGKKSKDELFLAIAGLLEEGLNKYRQDENIMLYQPSSEPFAKEQEKPLNVFSTEEQLKENMEINATSVDSPFAVYEVAAETPFFETLKQMDLSARLRNVLDTVEKSVKEERTFLDFIKDNDGFCQFVLRQRNFGRKSMVELFNLMENILEERLKVPEQNKGICANKISSYGSINKIEPVPAISTSSLQSTSVSPIPPGQIISEMISKMDSREAEVLQRRYGLGKSERETLEQIALDFNVSRERIRQLEKKALARLSHGLRGRLIKESTDYYTASLWDLLRGHLGIILYNDVKAAEEKIDAETLLAVEIAYGSFHNWLEAYATSGNLGWFRDAEAELDCIAATAMLQKELSERQLPLPLTAIMCEGCSGSFLASVARAAGWGVYLGYVCAGKIGTRKRRVIRLHRLLSRLWPGNHGIHELIDEYQHQHPDDLCTGRDAQIVMAGAPHLFIQVLEDQWSAIKPSCYLESYPENDLAESDEEDLSGNDIQGRWEENISIASTLESLLENSGPCRFADLRQRALDLLPKSTSPSSIGPILITSGRFSRVAPGLYALPKQVDAVAQGEVFPKAILGVDECLWFVEAMHAGCRHGDFPAWNWRLEFELCKWADNTNIDTALFDSLLFIVKPDNWKVSQGDRNYWSRVKIRRAGYYLDRPTPELSAALPPLERLLAAGLKLLEVGGINWVTINRILGKRVDHSGAASALAILVAVGVVDPTGHWQAFHQRTARTEDFCLSLATKMEHSGSLSWTDSIGVKELSFCRRRADKERLGWVPRAELNVLISLLSTSSGGLTSKPDFNEEPSDPLEWLLFKRRETQLNDRFSSLTNHYSNNDNKSGS